MARCAVIEDGVVVNIIVADATDTPPEGTILIELPYCSIGYLWDGVRFSPPEDNE
jgi:hypothetical protein